jgi:WD40 repeat protein
MQQIMLNNFSNPTTNNNSDKNNNQLVVKLAEKNDAKQWISDVKFSNDSSTLAIASHDCKIYIYDVKVISNNKNNSNKSNNNNNKTIVEVILKLRTIFAKHNAVINHFDFSVDGRFIQSCCRFYHLAFKNISSIYTIYYIHFSLLIYYSYSFYCIDIFYFLFICS